MEIKAVCSTLKDPSAAVEDCCAQLAEANLGTLSWVGIYFSDEYASEAVVHHLAAHLGAVPIHGGTSCMGVMSPDGFFSDQGVGLGLLAISDPAGSYGVGVADLADDPERAVKIATEKALAHAQRDGEVPALVWMNAAPGHEEKLIRGIEELVGPDVPITGGSTGDNTVSGNWRQVTGSGVFQNAVVISVFFPSGTFHYAFHSGYDPTDIKGRVTKAHGRTIIEIDGRPAGMVYNEWTQGLIGPELSSPGRVLAKTTMAPLGRVVGTVGGIPYYKLSHPSQVTKDGALALFSDIQNGDEIVLMTGSRDSLVTRAGRVAQSALSAGGLESDSIIGAIVVYCAGCMLTIKEEMGQVAEVIDQAIGRAPFLGIFTFGEQGCFIGNENTHGNLMISVVAFSRGPSI